MSDKRLGEIETTEHIDASDGENINAKRVGIYGYDYTNSQWRRQGVDPNGNLVSTSGLGIPAYDYCSTAYNTTDNTITYKTGGSGGTTVATVVVTFTDSTKSVISSITKT